MAVIGIDLGTTYSAAARFVDCETEIIYLEGWTVLPSVVGLDRRGRIVVGRRAKRNQADKPQDTIVEIKRKMGKAGETVMLGGKHYAPQEITALILRRIRQLAEEDVGGPVTGAVISCPACFGNGPRNAIREAGELAGLKVLRIVNEPTAAAYAYGWLQDDADQERLVMVYDLGGGTFDVTVLRMLGDSVEVLGTGGDPELGGSDFDDRIVDWMLERLRETAPEFLESLGVAEMEALKTRLKFHAEEGKMLLCGPPERDAHHFAVAKIGKYEGRPVSFEGTLTMEEFERRIEDLVQGSLRHLDEAMEVPKGKHGYTEEHLTDILLAGGSTRVPYVRRLLEERYPNVPLQGWKSGINPGEIVARGASIIAAQFDRDTEDLVEIMLHDVTNCTFGVMALDPDSEAEFMHPIIAKETPLPASATIQLTKAANAEGLCSVKLCEVDDAETRVLGEIAIEVDPGSGHGPLELTLHVDGSGLLTATVTDPDTGRSVQARIEYAQSLRLSSEDLEEKRAQLQALLQRRSKTEERASLENRTEEVVVQARRYCQQGQYGRARQLIDTLPDAPVEVGKIKRDVLAQIEKAEELQDILTLKRRCAHIAETAIRKECRLQTDHAERHTQDKEQLRAQIDGAIENSKRYVQNGDFAGARREIRALPDSPSEVGKLKSNLLSQIDEAEEHELLREQIEEAVARSRRYVLRGEFENARRQIRALPDSPGEVRKRKSNLLSQIDEAEEHALLREQSEEAIARSNRYVLRGEFENARRQIRALPDSPSEVGKLKRNLLSQIDEAETARAGYYDEIKRLLNRFNDRGIDLAAVHRIAQDNNIDISDQVQFYGLLRAIGERLGMHDLEHPRMPQVSWAVPVAPPMRPAKPRRPGFLKRLFGRHKDQEPHVAPSGKPPDKTQPPKPASPARGTPLMPTSRVDNVHFSVTSPPMVCPGTPFLIDVWAHLEEQRPAVIRRAEEAAGDTEILIRSRGPVEVAKGTVLSVRLEVEDLVVEDPEDDILWTGDIGTASFAVIAPKEVKPGPRTGRIGIYANGTQIARLYFKVVVGDHHQESQPLDTREERLKTAFASYSSADRDAVLARVQGMKKVAPCLDIFVDIISLRSGQDWKQELMKRIPASDTFYLFWSQNARESEHVDWEWRYALESRGIHFIDPVPLISPEIAKPPEELKPLHFYERYLAFMRWQEPAG